jgi:Domain of unknown function DUF1828
MMPCDLIAQQIGRLYECFAAESHTTIRTPYIFPDGDTIELFYQETPAGAVLTDFGETLRWLDGQTISERRTKRHFDLIQDVCANHRVQFDKGAVSIGISTPEMMADAVTRLAQAALRIADLTFTFRNKVFESFDDEVETFLWEHRVSFQRRFETKGASGTDWTIDFRTLRDNGPALVYTLSTGSRAAAKRKTDHVVAAFVDLQKLRSSMRFVSLVDDTIDVWEPEDFKQLEPHCEIANWSKPDDFLDQLSA